MEISCRVSQIGSGQTAIAAIKAKQHYVGYEINEKYVKLAEKRIKKFLLSFNVLNLFDLVLKFEFFILKIL